MPIDRLPRERYRWGVSPALQMLTMWGLAIAQPIYDLLVRGPEFLLAHRLERFDLIALVVAVSFVVPAGLWVLQLLERRSFGTKWLFEASMAMLAGILALQLVNGLPGWTAVVAACLLAAVFALFHSRLSVMATFILFLSPSSFIFPANFLFREPVIDLLAPPAIDSITGRPLVSSDTPIVMVVFDELPLSSLLDREKRIDSHLYPGFAALADTSYWFRNATAVAEGTVYSLPAILTGNYPDIQRIPRVQDYPDNLFTWLGSGYSMNVIESITNLCPADLLQATGFEEEFFERLRTTLGDLRILFLHLLLPKELSLDLPMVSGTWRDFGDPGETGLVVEDADTGPSAKKVRGNSAAIFDRFLRPILRTRKPGFHFLHINLPHLPWKYLPSGKEYGPISARLRPHGLLGEQWIDDDWATVQGFQRHLLQLRYTDLLLTRLLERLREADLFEKSLIIVTADHGVSFWPGGGRRGASEANFADILLVPLLIKKPFQVDPVLSDRNVEAVDLAATVADVIGEDLPWATDGESAFDSGSERIGKQFVDAKGREILGRVQFDVPSQSLERTLERMHSHFGAGDQIGGVFRVGRYGGLVGRQVSSLETIVDSPLSVALSDASFYENVDLEGSFLPANIVGKLSTDERKLSEPSSFAVAVNGIIQATTQSYDDRSGLWRFEALVSESAFRHGFNHLEIFEIQEHGERLSFARLENDAAVGFFLHLGKDGQPERLSASDGRSINVIEGAVAGEVADNGVSFKGWAGAVGDGRPAEELLVFAGSHLLLRTTTGSYRPDIAKRYGERGLVKAGFDFLVPFGFLESEGAPELVFFAVLDGVASRLPYSRSWNEKQEASEQPSKRE